MDQALTLVGGVVGKKIGQSYFGDWGGVIGGYLGQMAVSAALPSQKVRQEEAILEQRTITTASYGQIITWIFGRAVVGGNIIWAPADNAILPVRSEVTTGSSKGSSNTETTVVTYEYFLRCAFMLGEGPVSRIRRIWANDNLTFEDGKYYPDGSVTPSSGDDSMPPEGTEFAPGWRLYHGTDDQLPDPFMESFLGVGKTPAYRGRAIAITERFSLKPYGNSIPQFRFEVENYVARVEPTTTVTDWPTDTSIPPGARWLADFNRQTGALAMFVYDSDEASEWATKASQPLYVQRVTSAGLVIDAVSLGAFGRLSNSMSYTTLTTVGSLAVLTANGGSSYVVVQLSEEGNHAVIAARAPGQEVGPLLTFENGGLPDSARYTGIARRQHAGLAAVTAYAYSDDATDTKTTLVVTQNGAELARQSYFVPLRAGEQLTTVSYTDISGTHERQIQLHTPDQITPFDFTNDGLPTGGWAACWAQLRDVVVDGQITHEWSGDIATFNDAGTLYSQQAFDQPTTLFESRPYIDVRNKRILFPGAVVQLWEL